LSFFDWIRYKKIYSGTVERDGKLYKKYTKVRRFRISRSQKYIISIIGVLAVLAVLGIVVKLITSEMLSSIPAETQMEQ